MRHSTRHVLAVGLLLAVRTLLSSVCVAGDKRPAEVAQPGACDELIRRMGEDQECRKRTWETFSHSSASEPKAFDWNAFIRDLHWIRGRGPTCRRHSENGSDEGQRCGCDRVQKANRDGSCEHRAVKEIIDRFGWPGKSLVGGRLRVRRGSWCSMLITITPFKSGASDSSSELRKTETRIGETLPC